MNQVANLLASEQHIFSESVKNREPTYRAIPKKRFRWSTLRFEWGQWCVVSHPVSYDLDYYWWEWVDG